MTGEIAEQSPTTVLVVCTANVCRSPLAQEVLTAGLKDAGWLADIAVASAGANAEENLAMCEVSGAQRSDEAGVAFAAAHRSKHLTRQMVAAAGLVLTAEKEHRSSIARLAPGSQAKTFTWKEALLLAGAAQQRIAAGGTTRPRDLPELAHLLHSMRGTTPMQPTESKRGFFGRRKAEPADPLTVADGHGMPLPQHTAATAETKRVAEQLSAAFATLL